MTDAADEVTVVRAPRQYALDDLAARARPALEAAGAERAVVFGSWARGTADGYSDLDLAVVIDTQLPRTERWRLLAGVLDALPVPVDLLIFTPAEWAEGPRRGLGVVDAIAREGVTIHARSPR